MRLSEHPAFSQVDPDVMNHIQKALDTGSCKNGSDAIQKLIAVSKEIEKNHIHFTPQMQAVLLEYFKNQLPKNQRAQFNSILNLFLHAKDMPR